MLQYLSLIYSQEEVDLSDPIHHRSEGRHNGNERLFYENASQDLFDQTSFGKYRKEVIVQPSALKEMGGILAANLYFLRILYKYFSKRLKMGPSAGFG